MLSDAWFTVIQKYELYVPLRVLVYFTIYKLFWHTGILTPTLLIFVNNVDFLKSLLVAFVF